MGVGDGRGGVVATGSDSAGAGAGDGGSAAHAAPAIHRTKSPQPKNHRITSISLVQDGCACSRNNRRCRPELQVTLEDHKTRGLPHFLWKTLWMIHAPPRQTR